VKILKNQLTPQLTVLNRCRADFRELSPDDEEEADEDDTVRTDRSYVTKPQILVFKSKGNGIYIHVHTYPYTDTRTHTHTHTYIYRSILRHKPPSLSIQSERKRTACSFFA